MVSRSRHVAGLYTKESILVSRELQHPSFLALGDLDPMDGDASFGRITTLDRSATTYRIYALNGRRLTC